ncbi:MAG: DUF4199 domain-containing protein [Bacteroidaceae bacterium]|nr:DUF4199 domain-containing protein [Bacteroidaceae bacterium]
MQYGLVVGLLTSASFLATMYGLGAPTLGLLGNILGIFAFVACTRFIRAYRQETGELTFLQACYMAFLTFFFASLLTAVAQYLYLAFLDHGRLSMQIEQMLSMPEYEQWLKQMAGGADVEEVKKAAFGLVSNPAKMTLQLLWSDTLLSLLLAIPAALISRFGNKQMDK